MITILKWCLSWIASHGSLRLYTSPAPMGKRLGGHDIPGVVDLFVILDVRLNGRVIILGYFQAS